MTDKVTILVGTMSGTAEMVADELADEFDDAGFDARVLRMEKVRPETLAKGGLWVVCCSTYGTGELPDNAKLLNDALELERPNLSAVRFAVMALGDSVYPNSFCFGGKKIDNLLASLGAERLAERLDYDSRGGGYPEVAATTWLKTWIERIAA